MSPVEEFILEQPENIQAILKKLRFLILASTPQLEEKLTYNTPFFYLKKRIFYFNVKKDSVDLGFCNGFLLAKNDLLEIKNRNTVRTITYYSVKEVNKEKLLPLIHEAILVQMKNPN